MDNNAIVGMLRVLLGDTSAQSAQGLSMECPFEVGKSYFIRTVTYHWTGKVVMIVGKFLVLDSAAWIADSGRFMQAIKNGTLSEVEPVGDGVLVNIDSITDTIPWVHALPMDQK